MLLLNGKPIDYENKTQVLKEVDEGFKELRKMLERNNGTLHFVQNPERIKNTNNVRVIRGNVRTLMQSPVSIPMTSSVAHEKRGTETWAYSDGIPIEMGNNKHKPNPSSKIMHDGKLSVSEKKIELAYFLFFKSSLVISGKIIVDDPHQRESTEAAKRRADSKLNDSIYGEKMDSVILRKIARALMLGGIDELPNDDAIRNALYRTCMDDPAKTDKLYDLLGDKDEVEYRNVVTTAIDNSIIGYDTALMKWGYTNEDNQVVKEIVMMQPAQIPFKEEALVDYFKDNDKEFIELKKIVVRDNKKQKLTKMDQKELDGKLKDAKGFARTKLLKSICEDMNIPIDDKSNQEMYDDIVKNLK